MRREVSRKAIQSCGMAFAALGKTGGVLLLVAAALELTHLSLFRIGGLPLWRSLRAFGERNDGHVDPGPLLLALGAAPVLLLAEPPWSVAIVSLTFLADSAAAIVGLAAGGIRLPGSTGKTVMGSAGFFLVAMGMSLIAGLRFHHAFTLSFVGVLVEWVSPKGSDNLLLPVAGFSAMLLCS